MTRHDRREAATRELLEGTPAAMPPELFGAAVRRGRRLLRRRKAVRRAFWVLLCAAVLAFGVWAAVARPWAQPPSDTSPAVTDW